MGRSNSLRGKKVRIFVLSNFLSKRQLGNQIEFRFHSYMIKYLSKKKNLEDETFSNDTSD